MSSSLRWAGAVLVATFALLPASASGAVTIGTSLPAAGGATGTFSGANPTSTIWNAVLPAGALAPGGLTAPSYGVIVRFRLETAATNGATILSPSNPVQLRTITDQGSNHFRMTSTEATIHPVANVSAVQEFATRFPIEAGDELGIGVVGSASSILNARAATTMATARFDSPSLANGMSTSGAANTNLRLLLNADVEPDADHDGFGDQTQDGCPANAAVQVDCSPKAKKKCKKKKKGGKRSAAASKKKCKRKKH